MVASQPSFLTMAAISNEACGTMMDAIFGALETGVLGLRLNPCALVVTSRFRRDDTTGILSPVLGAFNLLAA
jgi:hypothetical protein